MATSKEKAKFITEIAPVIQKYATKYNYKVVSPIIAQAILESGWGLSLLGSKYHNYFGLKCGTYWKGGSVNMRTSEEYTPGTYTNISANFRTYDSMDAGVEGYFIFISTTRYKKLKDIDDPEEYLTEIKRAGYATSSTYVDSNMWLVNNHNLTDYDKFTNKSETATLTRLTQEVIDGFWGNGEERKKALTKAGYNYDEVQAEVNRVLSAAYPKYVGNSKSIVDALKAVGCMNTTYSFRKYLAEANGIKYYIGSAKQNGQMIALLKEGKLLMHK